MLVESGERNAGLARRAAAGQGLAQVEVRQADASLVAGFTDALPADVLLLCGIFGNISDRDIKRTVAAAPALCRTGATVIWTRHRRPPDLTPQIRAWFAAGGFEEIAFDALQTSVLTSVGVSRSSALLQPGCLAAALYLPHCLTPHSGQTSACRSLCRGGLRQHGVCTARSGTGA